ncbi:UDP-3-O-(3-hydroxymyristoyl)glucosamine N-acyltransferase [Verrucomicrobia bacterium]|nr:UDP-3-O-(3-hydroxymyristoyl)glucosamine N-acyltransferase [Verrucomicrobiota bacterium]
MSHTVEFIATQLGGTVDGDGSIELTGFAMASDAKQGDLTFAENEKYFELAQQSQATAILVQGENFASGDKTLIRVKQARVGFAKAVAMFFPEPEYVGDIHPSAVVHETANVDESAHIGPQCVIEAGASIGANVVLQGINSVGAGSKIDEGTHLFPNVSIYRDSVIGKRVRIHSGSVIGSDGFGYVWDGAQHLKVPQIGNVVIGDDVEIGANVAIDRGALGSTSIGAGSKIDNLVQIAHNVEIGPGCIIVSQAGVAGSSKLGHHTTLAGQVGIAGHLKIGSQVTVAAQSGVMHDIPDGETWFGSPACPDKQMKRIIIAMQRLPELTKMARQLQKKFGVEI